MAFLELQDIAAVIISIVIAVIALWALQYNRRTVQLKAFTDMMAKWETPEFIIYRDIISKPLEPPIVNGKTVKTDAQRAISHFFDTLGALAAYGYIDKKPVYRFLGIPIIRYWHDLSSHIMSEREQPGRNIYQLHFEWLYNDVKVWNECSFIYVSKKNLIDLKAVDKEVLKYWKKRASPPN